MKYLIVRINMDYDNCEGVDFIGVHNSYQEAFDYIQNRDVQFKESYKPWDKYNKEYISIVCQYNKQFFNENFGYTLGDAHNSFYDHQHDWYSNPKERLKPYHISNPTLQCLYEKISQNMILQNLLM